MNISDALGLSSDEAARWESRRCDDPADAWRTLCDSTLLRGKPFELHQRIHEWMFEKWDAQRGPAPAWVPSPQRIARANITALQRSVGLGDVPSLHRWSIENQEKFIEISLERLGVRFRHWPARMLDASADAKSPRWFVEAKLNIADSCFQAKVDQPAIVFSTADGSLARWTYGELRALSNRVSNGLRRAGFAPGDAIAALMPMNPESVAIYLGIVQAGCVVISIADSFAPAQIATRLKIADARGVFTIDRFARGGKAIEMYEKVKAAEAPRAIVLRAGDAPLRDGDIAWENFLSDNDEFIPLIRTPDDTINILFSSGTTGEPKAIPFDHTSPIKCAIDGHYHHDLHPGDVVAWPTSLGWMMGPWLIFATLINRGTIALHHDMPTERSFGQFVQDARVNMLGVVPSIVRRWRETRCIEGLDWSNVQTFSSTGECSNAQDMLYLMHLAGYKPVIEYCGGTEIGGGFICSTVVQNNAPSTFSTPALGSELILVDDDGRETDVGELFLVPPAIGLSRRLIKGDHERVYYAGASPHPDGRVLRRHGDQFQRLPGGYWRALGRADDTMNLGGIKVSSAEIERALHGVADVKETAAIAVNPPGGGPSRLVIYAVLSAPVTRDELLNRLRHAVRQNLNPLFKVEDVVVVDSLPRTASQKVMRRELRAAFEKSSQAGAR